jgi:hypothetical protein
MPASSSAPGDDALRKRQWIAVLAAAVLAVPIWSFRGTAHQIGLDVDAPITLITSDRDDLSCASSRAFGSYRCEFAAPNEPAAPVPAAADRLAPYLSETRQMFLIPGLFEQPELRSRYDREPPRGVARGRLRRFTARCRLKLVERVDGGFQVRWERSGTWGRGDVAWVATVTSCRVEG